ncbi:MBL fold metallo-hydrolase [Pseudalkalibacillus hwajinpoensis]|uniref:MBL fold metallo-hydrolase n=1 Tax=Guptibacillus hwajinpoensis TaxID=208199 RepID=UPI001CD68903|nr:MBL fold metallo-hydrolase [Pseudalkalibacillus hwajinpoensis]
MKQYPTRIAEDLSLIDLYDLSLTQRTGCYVLHEEELTIIETSASPSIPHLLNGLEKLHIDLDDVRHIIVTHIHLDHAGGAGLLLKKCPNARILVHSKGARHLENPTRLIQGAKAVYGERFKELFDPILPIPEDRLVIMKDYDELKIGKKRTLTFIDTPGHAKHHFSIHDSKTNGMFVGDTVGVYYPQLDVELYLPSTSPNQFDLDDMLASADKIMSFKPSYIYFGHYGMSNHPPEVIQQLKAWLSEFSRITEEVIGTHHKNDERSEHLFKTLFSNVQGILSKQGVPLDHPVYQYIKMDLHVSALGLLDYTDRKKVRTT